MRKKILFVINTLGGGGAEAALLTLLRQMDPGRYECFLYVVTGQGELARKLPEHVTLLNKDYCDVSVLSKRGLVLLAKNVFIRSFRRGAFFRNVPYFLSNLADMIKRKRIQTDKLLWRMLSDSGQRFEEKYDLAVAFLEGASTYYVAEHVKAKKKVCFIHIDYGKAGYTKSLDRGCYDSFQKIFTVSDEVKKAFLDVYPEYASRTEIFPNLIDRKQILRRAKEPGGAQDGFDGIRILTVGRLTEQKAYDISIDAARLILDAGYRIRWYVLGEGAQRSKLERQIAKQGLKQDFILVGAVENPFPYYAQTDLYVHATRYEGKSIAIQEAQILGCAVIASDRSGNREQIEDGVDGRLCGLSAEEIRDCVIDLIEHPEKRALYAQNARKKMKNFSQDAGMLLELL